MPEWGPGKIGGGGYMIFRSTNRGGYLILYSMIGGHVFFSEVGKVLKAL